MKQLSNKLTKAILSAFFIITFISPVLKADSYKITKYVCPVCLEINTGKNSNYDYIPFNGFLYPFEPWGLMNSLVRRGYQSHVYCDKCGFSMQGLDRFFTFNYHHDYHTEKNCTADFDRIARRAWVIFEMRDKAGFIGKERLKDIYGGSRLEYFEELEMTGRCYKYLFRFKDFHNLYKNDRTFFMLRLYAYTRRCLEEKYSKDWEKKRCCEIGMFYGDTYFVRGDNNKKKRYKEGCIYYAYLAAHNKDYLKALEYYKKAMQSIHYEKNSYKNTDRIDKYVINEYNTIFINNLEFLASKNDTDFVSQSLINLALINSYFKNTFNQEMLFIIPSLLMVAAILGIIHFIVIRVKKYRIPIVVMFSAALFIIFDHIYIFTCMTSVLLMILLFSGFYFYKIRIYKTGTDVEKRFIESIVFKRIRYSVIWMPVVLSFHTGIEYLMREPVVFSKKFIPAILLIFITVLISNIIRSKNSTEKPGLYPYTAVLLVIPYFKFFHQNIFAVLDWHLGCSHIAYLRGFVVVMAFSSIIFLISYLAIRSGSAWFRSRLYAYIHVLIYSFSTTGILIITPDIVWNYIDWGEKLDYYAKIHDFTPHIIILMTMISSALSAWFFIQILEKILKGSLSDKLPDKLISYLKSKEWIDTNKLFVSVPIITGIVLFILQYNYYKLYLANITGHILTPIMKIVVLIPMALFKISM